MTPHHEFSDAIEKGDVDSVVSLIQRHPELVNHPDWTPPPLHCAVLWDQPQIVELLLDHGADIEMRDPDRDTTPLRYAIMFGKARLIPLLLSRGAIAGAIDENGTTALELAIAAAAGEYEEYEDLPSREVYADIVERMRQLGLT